MGIEHAIGSILPQSAKRAIKSRMDPKTHTAHRPYVLGESGRFPLKGRVAVVTGGSGEIGRAICLRLAADGARVRVGSRSLQGAMDVVGEIRALGLLGDPMEMDIADAGAVERAFEMLRAEGCLPDILVNCAGGSARGDSSPMHSQDPIVYRRVVEDNLIGTMNCVRYGCAKLMESGWGRIINVGSSVGIGGKSGFSEYAASKAGVHGLTRSLALEMGRFGTTVNCVSPGVVLRGDYSESQAEYARSVNCMNVVGTPEDVASAVSYLASPEAGFVTGQIISVDGGRTLGRYGDRA